MRSALAFVLHLPQATCSAAWDDGCPQLTLRYAAVWSPDDQALDEIPLVFSLTTGDPD